MEREILDSKNNLDLNQTPNANRIHISFFGRRNAGKSSIVNAITGQDLSVVSDVKGTTTDPVSKAMELLPLGPVLIIDTPGFDDDGLLGEKRVKKTQQVLAKTNVAVLVVDSSIGIGKEEKSILKEFKEINIPFIVAMNKSDLKECKFSKKKDETDYLYISALTGNGIEELKELIAAVAKPFADEVSLLGDFIDKNDIVILVTPIDSSAPKGRMILPQVQAIRDILDNNCICIVTQVPQLKDCLNLLSVKPKLVVTDSQAFSSVKAIVPENIALTSFSIIMARFKGVLDQAVEGAQHLSNLEANDTVLISEGCTHHRQCEDIGTVKLPTWIEDYCGKKLNFEFTSGGDFPPDEELANYSLIVHCGGCMLNQREMMHRMNLAKRLGIPYTNYGTLIANINGILDRSLEIIKKGK